MDWYDELVDELFGSGGGGELDSAMMAAGSTPVTYNPTDYGGLDAAMMAAGSTPLSYGGSAGTPFYLDPRFLQGAGSLIGGVSQAYAGQRAAGTQADAADRAAALQERIYNSMAARNLPAETGGNLARDRYLDLVGLGKNTNAMGYGSAVQPFDMSKFEADPGAAFRFKTGMDALKRREALGGNLFSSQALKNAQQFGQDYASQEYANAYNRYRQNRADQLAPLSDLMTGGTNAINATNTAMGNYGTNAANLMGQAGQATAAGQLGVGNSVNNLAGAFNQQYNTNQMMDILRESRRSAYS
jgi:hypothetical protein